MAGEARLGEAGREVIRIRGCVVFGGVARIAIGWRGGEVAADVARHALCGGVFADQVEAHSGVVESGTQPVIRGVAQRAILRKTQGGVIWICRGGVVSGMARVAGGA